MWKKEVIYHHKQAEQDSTASGVQCWEQKAILQSDIYSQLKVLCISLPNTARHSSEMANDWRLCDVERH